MRVGLLGGFVSSGLVGKVGGVRRGFGVVGGGNSRLIDDRGGSEGVG
jgi:hypothetical protein